MSKLVTYTLALGALFLLCTCADRESSRAPATSVSLSAPTAIPTAIPIDAALPGSLPSIAPTGVPLTSTLNISEQGPSGADLAIQVLGPLQLIPDQTTAYTLTMQNRGPDAATGIVLTYAPPSGVTLLWAEPSRTVCERLERYVGCDLGDWQGGDAGTVTLDLSVGGTETLLTSTQLAGVSVDRSVPTCAISQDATQSQVTCYLTSLPAGAEARVQIGMEVDAWQADTPSHTVTVEANEADPNPSNNVATFTSTAGSLTSEGTSAGDGPIAVTIVPTTTDLVVQADGPTAIIAGQPFTYTYTISNQGALVAREVKFEDVLPSDLSLITYAPGLPLCEQCGDEFTCSLRDLESGETVTFTLVITGHAGQPVMMELDPLLPGWPICYVVKERTWLHIVHCELGDLQPRQATRVQLVLSAVGVQERRTANTAYVSAREAELNPADNTITTTITVQAPAEP